jgi:hypothetical protein
VAAEATDGLTWADVVGRDGIEPPTLRFSAECGTCGSVRRGSPESHSLWSAGAQEDWSFGVVQARAARCRSVGQNIGRIAPAPAWTRHTRSRGQRRSAWRTLAGKVDPRRLPPTSEPRLGDRLVRGSPGGVWARDIPLYRRAVPGQRHGDSPASCWFKPCARRWPSGARSRQDQCQPRPADPLLAKPDRLGSSPRRSRMAQVEAAVGLSVGVRWRPVGTAMNGTVVARALG